MAIHVRGESVYECDVCKRRIRVPNNKTGIDVIQRCIITNNCQGKLHRITLAKDIISTPAFPVEEPGVTDWFQRQKLYTHTQTIQKSTWVVTHNMGNNPSIYVYVYRSVNDKQQLVQVTPKSIKPIDINTCWVIFDAAESGIAQCIASSSQNDINPQQNTTANSTEFQLTHNGELTFATIDDSQSVALSLTYNSPSSTQPVIVGYTAITGQSVESPWIDVDMAIVNGKKFKIRSVNILTHSPGPIYFEQNAISSGSTVNLTNSINANTTIILLSNSPYSTPDKITTQYIDAATLFSIASLYYNNGELFVNKSVLKNTYPSIITM